MTGVTEREILIAARDKARETLEVIEAALAAWQSMPVASQSRQLDDADLVAPCEAAERFGVDTSTIRRWARQSGIGQRQGGRWRISVERLKQHLASLR